MLPSNDVASGPCCVDEVTAALTEAATHKLKTEARTFISSSFKSVKIDRA
jgi:hypothetical protein